MQKPKTNKLYKKNTDTHISNVSEGTSKTRRGRYHQGEFYRLNSIDGFCGHPLEANTDSILGVHSYATTSFNKMRKKLNFDSHSTQLFEFRSFNKQFSSVILVRNFAMNLRGTAFRFEAIAILLDGFDSWANTILCKYIPFTSTEHLSSVYGFNFVTWL